MKKSMNSIVTGWGRKVLPLFLFTFLPLTISAQDSKSQFRPIDHAVISQTIAPDARSAGMGDIGAATDPDVNSQYWNPAKYPFCISKAGVSLNYTPWLRQLVNDIDLAYLSGYYRIGDYAAISGSLRYFSLGEVYTDYENENAMTVKPYEMSLDVGASLMLSENFSIAAALRWLYSDLRYDYTEDASPASAFAADLACYYQNYLNIGPRECQLGLGMNISNVGSKITYFGDDRSQFLPANLRLGASLMIPVDEYNRFTIAADANKLLVPMAPTEDMWKADDPDGTKYGSLEAYAQEKYNDISSISGIFKSFSDAPGGFKEEMEEIQWSVGAEYVYHDQFSIRAGYHHQAESKGNMKYFTVGGGFRMSVFSLDVGYVISTARSNPLDQTLRFTLAFDMDGIKDLFKR
jgi:hypothetical protein